MARVVRLGLNCSTRLISELAKSKGAFLVDTLQLVRALEAEGIPSKQAEAITAAVQAEAEMHKAEMLQESNLSKFKSKVQGSQDQNIFSMTQRETEKLRSEGERMRSELRHQIEKGRNELNRNLDALGGQLKEAKYDLIKFYIGFLVSISAVCALGVAEIRNKK